jgi:hypothetical protein
MRFVLELEIKSIVHVLDIQAFLGSIMLNNELFKKEEGSFVINSLSNLDLSNPQMRSVCLLTVWALLICDNKLYDETLLKESAIENFLLDSQLDLNTL